MSKNKKIWEHFETIGRLILPVRKIYSIGWWNNKNW